MNEGLSLRKQKKTFTFAFWKIIITIGASSTSFTAEIRQTITISIGWFALKIMSTIQETITFFTIRITVMTETARIA